MPVFRRRYALAKAELRLTPSAVVETQLPDRRSGAAHRVVVTPRTLLRNLQMMLESCGRLHPASHSDARLEGAVNPYVGHSKREVDDCTESI
jgi:hypothetical protein